MVQYVAMDLAHGRRFCRPRRLRAPVCWPTAWVTWTWSCGPSFAGALDPDEAAIDASNTTTNFIVCGLWAELSVRCVKPVTNN